MSLIFHDDQVICPECGSHLFKEETTYALIEKKDRFGNKYYDVDDMAYSIACANCKHIISISQKSITNKKR